MRILPLLILTPLLAAQAPPQEEPEPIRVDVDVVNVLATVRDRRGGLVSSLQKEDFTVLEDGKPQEIRYFTRETDLPLTIGLLVDVSPSQQNLIAVESRAASEFFTRVLRPKDLAFLISFGEEAELLHDLTGSARQLTSELQGLRISSSASGLGPGPVPTISRPRGTVLYDAVYLAAVEKLRSEVGRKTIVIISDGVDQGSRVTLDQAIEAAQKADTVIYSIEYYDAAFYAGRFGGVSELKKLSEATGGRVFKVDRKNTLDRVFQDLQEELRSQYAIGYTPANQLKDGGYRKLEIKTARKDLKVQARKGYYAVKPDLR